jgi:hypothetical protein
MTTASSVMSFRMCNLPFAVANPPIYVGLLLTIGINFKNERCRGMESRQSCSVT